MAEALALMPVRCSGSLQAEAAEPPLAGAVRYSADHEGDALEYAFAPGALAEACYLAADTLLDGVQLVVFRVSLQEGEDGPTFRMTYGLLNQCSARMRIPLLLGGQE